MDSDNMEHSEKELAEFVTRYTGNPDFNYDDEEGEEGFMEIFSPHIERVVELNKVDPTKVWTVSDSEFDDGLIIISAGMHFVNRVHYFISNESWTDPEEVYIW
ncbi:MAG: hypothetical protein ACTIM4_01685 [Marinomonas sp.]